MTDIDTTNYHMVGVTGGGQVVVRAQPSRPLTKQQALVFAAWLVVVAEEQDGEFERVLTAVRDT